MSEAIYPSRPTPFFSAATTLALALLCVAARTSRVDAQRNPPPRVWASITEGFGLAWGDRLHRSTIAHTPRGVAGIRLTTSVGIEGGAEWLAILDNAQDFTRPLGAPPSYAGAVGNVVFMSPGRSNEWERTLSVGAGSFHRLGQTDQVLGLEASAESAIGSFRFATITSGARVVFIPRDNGAHFIFLSGVLSIRTRYL